MTCSAHNFLLVHIRCPFVVSVKKTFHTIFSQFCSHARLLSAAWGNAADAGMFSLPFFISAQCSFLWMLQTLTVWAELFFVSLHFLTLLPSTFQHTSSDLLWFVTLRLLVLKCSCNILTAHGTSLALIGVISNWITSSIIFWGNQPHLEESMPQDLLDFHLVWVFVSVLKTEEIPAVPIHLSQHL